MIKNLLKQLNFSEKETNVYLALLELGSAKAKEISKKTDLNRTTVYDICDILLKKGIISQYKKGSATYFNALEPKHLLNYLDREKEEQINALEKQKQKVSELLPQLISLQNIFTSKPKIQFFEGEKGMREAYEDTLTSKETILAYANVETMHEGLPNFFPEYYKNEQKTKYLFVVYCQEIKNLLNVQCIIKRKCATLDFCLKKKLPFRQKLISMATRC